MVRVTVLGASEAMVGAGDSQACPAGAHVAGNGPIEAEVALAAPSSGTVALDRSSWIDAPGAAWVRPAQVR